jgi:hypothetical protein
MSTSTNPNPTSSATLSPETYVSKKQVALFFGRSTRWVELMHHEGLPSYQLTAGGRRMYRFSEVNAWISQRAGVTALTAS